MYTFKLPVGRIVSGSPTFKQDKDQQGRLKEKPNWFFATAVPKTDPNVNSILAAVFQVANDGYRSNSAVIARIQQGLNGAFAWKIEDGDKPENRGKEGYAGCWIFKYSTTLGVPDCYDANNNPMDAALIKRGYFVEVFSSCQINANQDHTAGVYMNPNMVRFVAFGPEIKSGPTAAEVFGAPAPIPPGGSAAPVGGQGVPGAPGVAAAPGAGNPFDLARATAAPGVAGAAPGGFPGVNAPAAQGGATAGFPAPSAGMPPQAATAFPSNQYPGGQVYTGGGMPGV